MNKGGKFLKKLWCCVGGRVFPSTFVLYNLPFQEEIRSPLNPGASRHLKYTNYFHEENNTSYLFLKLVVKTGVSNLSRCVNFSRGLRVHPSGPLFCELLNEK